MADGFSWGFMVLLGPFVETHFFAEFFELVFMIFNGFSGLFVGTQGLIGLSGGSEPNVLLLCSQSGQILCVLRSVCTCSTKQVFGIIIGARKFNMKKH